jgi:hypothetical protein
MTTLNWMNVFHHCDVSVTVLIDGIEENNAYRETRLKNSFNTRVITAPINTWLSAVNDIEANGETIDKKWIILTPIGTLPVRSFESRLIEELAVYGESEFIIPACMRSNTHALRSNEIYFCNSLHEFDYDFQPQCLFLALSSKENPATDAYYVLNGSFSTILIKYSSFQNAIKQINICRSKINSKTKETFRINNSKKSKILYSQSIRVYRI